MKAALCVFVCDAELGWDICGDESPPESAWTKARVTARAAGWWLGPGGAALCPPHAAERRQRLSRRPNGASRA